MPFARSGFVWRRATYPWQPQRYGHVDFRPNTVSRRPGLARTPWRELHLHHQAVATYRPLAASPDVSWARRREWYRRIPDGDGAYFLAAEGAKPVGYAMVQVHSGARPSSSP